MKNLVAMPFSKTASCCLSQTFALVLLLGATAYADTLTVYNSIPDPLPGNVGSEGPEAYAFRELGDGFTLAGPVGRTLDKVTVILSSWACVAGNWFTPNTCFTPKGSTFNQPITVNLYAVSPPTTVGPLLATITQNFVLPYRPSSDPAHCPDGQTWYSARDKICYHGLAVPITVDLSSHHLSLPGKIIVTVSYNTSTAGPSPVGTATACRASAAGCPYDSLNISTDSNGGVYQAIGSVLDPNSIFVNYILPNNSCSGTAPPGLALDAGCWAGFHPMMRVSANKNSNEKENEHGDK